MCSPFLVGGMQDAGYRFLGLFFNILTYTLFEVDEDGNFAGSRMAVRDLSF
jgi:hypothetical protein